MDLKICLLLLIAIGMVAALPAPGRGRRVRRHYDGNDYDRPRSYDEYDDEDYYEPISRRRGRKYRQGCVNCSTGWARWAAQHTWPTAPIWLG